MTKVCCSKCGGSLRLREERESDIDEDGRGYDDNDWIETTIKCVKCGYIPSFSINFDGIVVLEEIEDETIIENVF